MTNVKDLKYLVVKCELLSDQYECDAYRKPLFMTDDWCRDCKGYEILFEVYELNEKTRNFKLIKEYYD